MSEELWCVVVEGPDDIHPAPSRDEAEKGAIRLNEYWKKEREVGDVLLNFVAKPWPYSAEGHQRRVNEFGAIFGTSSGNGEGQ